MDKQHMIEKLPSGHMETSVYTDPDGKLYLVVSGMFAVNNVVHGVRMPFSDFSETLTCANDLESAVVNATHRCLFGCDDSAHAR